MRGMASVDLKSPVCACIYLRGSGEGAGGREGAEGVGVEYDI